MSEEQKKVKVAVCGVGALGQHHARIYAEMDSCELVGVYDADEERARAIADQHGTAVFSSLDELAESVAAASLVVPTDLHHEVALELLHKDIHLLVEKPIAENEKQAEDMVNLANRRNLILQVGHIERFNPVLSILEKQAANPRFIEAHRLAPYPPVYPGERPRGTEVSVVLDLMIHDLELILHLVRSEVKTISAVGINVLSPTEDIANVRLTFENGCVANVTASRVSPEKMRKLRLFLEDAYVSLDFLERKGEIHRMENGEISHHAVPVGDEDALESELGSFVACVRHHHEPLVTGEHAARALKLAVEIIQTIKHHPS